MYKCIRVSFWDWLYSMKQKTNWEEYSFIPIMFCKNIKDLTRD